MSEILDEVFIYPIDVDANNSIVFFRTKYFYIHKRNAWVSLRIFALRVKFVKVGKNWFFKIL